MNITPPERTLLEALVVSPDLPKIQDRADILLRASAGAEDEQIAAALSMKEKDVRHWRKRFEAEGVRGLWDPPGSGPKRQVTPEKEAAVLQDVFYPILRLNANLLAQKHRLSRSAVNRILVKHEIVRDKLGRIDIRRLRVFADPLFGVTVSGIAGLYCGTSGVLALSTSNCAFSELHLVVPSSLVVQKIDGFLIELGKLAKRLSHPWVIDPASEQNRFLNWLQIIEGRHELDSEIHLITDLPNQASHGSPAVREWLAEHPHFKVHYAPLMQAFCWSDLVWRCFQIIVGLPMQVNFIKQVMWMAQYLARIPDKSPVGAEASGTSQTSLVSPAADSL